MKLHGVKECIDVHDSDLSGSSFDDVNMSGSTIRDANLAGCSLRQVNMSGAAFEDFQPVRMEDPRRQPLRPPANELQSAGRRDHGKPDRWNDDQWRSSDGFVRGLSSAENAAVNSA